MRKYLKKSARKYLKKNKKIPEKECTPVDEFLCCDSGPRRVASHILSNGNVRSASWTSVLYDTRAATKDGLRIFYLQQTVHMGRALLSGPITAGWSVKITWKAKSCRALIQSLKWEIDLPRVNLPPCLHVTANHWWLACNKVNCINLVWGRTSQEKMFSLGS